MLDVGKVAAVSTKPITCVFVRCLKIDCQGVYSLQTGKENNPRYQAKRCVSGERSRGKADDLLLTVLCVESRWRSLLSTRYSTYVGVFTI